MINKIFLVLLLVCLSFTSCKAEENKDHNVEDGYHLWTQSLEIENGLINIYIDYINEEKGIAKSFYSSLLMDQDSKRVLNSNDGWIEDSEENVIINLSDHHLGFYGYGLKLSYPKNPIYTPGIIIIPYFSLGDSVGDSFVIEWNYEKEMFQLRKYNLP